MFGQLTAAGRAAGGVYLTGKYGQYVAWPEARSSMQRQRNRGLQNSNHQVNIK
ncbi:hypothetical protein [Methylomonas koyamae]|uniref:hypothetical protein n=1 Tax=Methylomonas koyamae TaxID=702114 RepID=UPI000B1A38A8|nr:hypothetical protein [Methylomonas koyamae]